MHTSFDWKARMAAEVMRYGGVIAYPTEAVWGLGADPFNEQAVRRILAIKQRPEHKGLILLSGQLAHFSVLIDPLDKSLQQRFFEPQSRATTWLVPDPKNLVPVWVKGSHSSVAVRVTQHPLCSALTAHFKGPIISTSANPAGFDSAGTLQQAKRYFSNDVDAYAQAPLGGAATASQIKDLKTGKVLRG